MEDELDFRKKRLWEHIKELERVTGRSLRTRRREPIRHWTCPIEQYAPDTNSEGLFFHAVMSSGSVIYNSDYNEVRYQIYNFDDSYWWGELSNKDKLKVLEWVEEKIRSE